MSQADYIVCPPTAVTTGMLTSDAIESAAAWTTATYSLGNVVSRLNRRWESLQNSNTNKPPEANPSFWLDLGPTNPWAMFDEQISTQTTRADSLRVELAIAGRMDTLGLLNVDASSVNVTLKKGAVEIYNRDFSMVNYNGIANYADHHFKPVSRRRTLTLTGLPIVTGLTLIVTFTNTGANAACGHLVFGRGQVLGQSQYGATLGYRDFSNFEADATFAVRSLIKRDYKKQGDFDVWIPDEYVDRVYDLVTGYRATPVLIIASSRYSSSIYFGLITAAKITIAYHKYSVMRISTEDF